jgi:hypothetical protein
MAANDSYPDGIDSIFDLSQIFLGIYLRCSAFLAC